jgi:hypothetical protein
VCERESSREFKRERQTESVCVRESSREFKRERDRERERLSMMTTQIQKKKNTCSPLSEFSHMHREKRTTKKLLPLNHSYFRCIYHYTKKKHRKTKKKKKKRYVYILELNVCDVHNIKNPTAKIFTFPHLCSPQKQNIF